MEYLLIFAFLGVIGFYVIWLAFQFNQMAGMMLILITFLLFKGYWLFALILAAVGALYLLVSFFRWAGKPRG